MYKLRAETTREWVECVLDDFDTFLLDHAAAERKAAAASEHFAVRYRDKPELIDAMLRIAREELEHFHQVFHLIHERGGMLGPDEKDPYVNRLLEEARTSGEKRLLDRLLIGSLIEYRGCERFALLSRGLDNRGAEEELVVFYRNLAADDSRHRTVYFEMAHRYFEDSTVDERLEMFLDLEADIIRDLAIRPALH